LAGRNGGQNFNGHFISSEIRTWSFHFSLAQFSDRRGIESFVCVSRMSIEYSLLAHEARKTLPAGKKSKIHYF
jgi:hypothetical protein